jgi:hypothetical protein
MFSTDDIQEIVNDFGSRCQVEQVARPVFMILYPLSSGHISSRLNALQFVDKTTLPRGADWAYGLILAEDAPPAVADARLKVTDNLGAVWNAESVKALLGVDDGGMKYVIAWRLALRGTQHGVRGK